MVLTRTIIQRALLNYLDLYLAKAKDNGFHQLVFLDLWYYFRFEKHIVKHFSRDLNNIEWNDIKEDEEFEWLMFWLPFLKDMTNPAKLEKKIEEMLDDNKCPNCLYQAVEYISDNIERYNIHEVFKKWD